MLFDSEASLRLADSLLDEFREERGAPLEPGLFQKLLASGTGSATEAEPTEFARQIHHELTALVERIRSTRESISVHQESPSARETAALLEGIERHAAALVLAIEGWLHTTESAAQ
ncbi:MAG: hypothetical protein ACREMQ_06600 [Longimicrobiales bacterium]